MATELTSAKVRDYLSKTRSALEKLQVIAPDRSMARGCAEDFLAMARAYFSDAEHFFEKGEMVNAFACVNYAHGWLDAGVRLGLFDVGGDDQLFTLYK
ncbi:MAG: DUF357 domain-containing protein [Candidatus Thermoplasmatota archaeon]